MNDEPLVYVVVLNYNGKSHLEYCLPSILSTNYGNFEVLLVDNDSTDGSVSYVEENFPDVTILRMNENLGWAGGNNAGIEYARDRGADHVVLANNDIRVHPEWLAAAVEAAESDPTVGFVGFDVLGVARHYPVEDFETACEEWHGTEYRTTEEFINGMALFARIEVFSQIGMIDEGYFIYSEETDLEIRAERAGYKRLRTNVPVWHHNAGTMGDTPLKSGYYAIRNRIRLAIKHESPLQIVKTVLSLYNIGCNPFLDYDEDDQIVGRRRPRGTVFNFFFITLCLLWNLAHLHETWSAKRRDYRKIETASIG